MATEPDIRPKMQAERAFQTIARACLQRFTSHMPELRQNWDAEALHQARVGLRQLIAAFTLFKPMIEDDAFFALKARVKSAARTLGEARNLDIFLEAAHRPGLPALRSSVSVRRSSTYASVNQRLESPGNLTLAEDVLTWLDNGAWLKRCRTLREERVDRFIERRLAAKWRKFRARARHLPDLAPQPRHKVRIAAKELRYGLEFIAPLAKRGKAQKHLAAMLGELKTLQDALGTLNDVRTERELADDFVREGRAIAFAAGRLIGAEEARTAPLLRRAAKTARRLRKREPFWM